MSLAGAHKWTGLIPSFLLLRSPFSFFFFFFPPSQEIITDCIYLPVYLKKKKTKRQVSLWSRSNEILILDRGGLVGSTHLWRDIPATLKSLINATRNVAAFCTTTDAYLSSNIGPSQPGFLPLIRVFVSVCTCARCEPLREHLCENIKGVEIRLEHIETSGMTRLNVTPICLDLIMAHPLMAAQNRNRV